MTAFEIAYKQTLENRQTAKRVAEKAIALSKQENDALWSAARKSSKLIKKGKVCNACNTWERL